MALLLKTDSLRNEGSFGIAYRGLSIISGNTPELIHNFRSIYMTFATILLHSHPSRTFFQCRMHSRISRATVLSSLVPTSRKRPMMHAALQKGTLFVLR